MPNEKGLLFKHRKGIGREHTGKRSSTANAYAANENCRILAWFMAQRSGDGTHAVDGKREGAGLMALYLRSRLIERRRWSALSGAAEIYIFGR